MSVLDLVSDALLPPDGSEWRRQVPRRALERLHAQPTLRGQAAQLRLFLRLLDTAGGCFFLGGRRTAFSRLDRSEREAVLQRMQTHPVGAVRGAALSLKRLLGAVYFGDTDALGSNPTWARLEYPGPLVTASPSADGPRPIAPLRMHGATTLECDVAIVGSGAGGGIVAAQLAARGLRVVVLERGPYLADGDFDQRELDTYARAYLDGALGATADLGTLLLAGACLGGGTVVNYTTSFRTPDDVRAEWSRLSGLGLFASDRFAEWLDRASETLSVNQAHNTPSARDAVMGRGLVARGMHVDAMPRNVVGCTQDDTCGYCGLGCVRGAKRSTLKACLESAVADGARVLVSLDVARVLVERGRAVGVVGTDRASGASVTVRARMTVVAAGALGSPALLLRSRLGGADVGRHLRLHPVTAVWGHFPDEPIRPWTGTLQALYSTEFADLDGAGYGVRFETAPVHPSLMALAMPWPGAAEYGALVERMARSSLIGVLTRDRSEGSVRVTRAGRAVVRYVVSADDRVRIRQGVLGAADVLAAAGAHEIFVSQNRYAPWRCRSEPLAAWTERIDRVGFGSNQALYVSFHQMGTCRMGRDPRSSVVAEDGQVHDVPGLYVADGSLFPSASGVNPMLTIAALAHHVADCIARAL